METDMRIATAALLVLASGALLAAQTADAPAINLRGKLYKSVFSSGAGALNSADLAGLPEPLRDRLDRYLVRRAEFKSRYKSDPDSLDRMRIDAKRRALERSMASLVEAPGIEGMAADFVADAPIAAEWNGLPEKPIAEAGFAEDVLKKNPGSPIAPWLYLFIAERHRVAFESYENGKTEEGMKTSARKYRTFIERARSVEDPVYRAIADDMDRLPYLYIKSTNHPRDYAPDS